MNNKIFIPSNDPHIFYVLNFHNNNKQYCNTALLLVSNIQLHSVMQRLHYKKLIRNGYKMYAYNKYTHHLLKLYHQ